jgi:hypothetical protein
MSGEPIVRHVFQITVLRPVSEPFPDDLDLDTLHELVDTGPMIGSGLVEISAEELNDEDRIISELRAVGNDGTFFDDIL